MRDLVPAPPAGPGGPPAPPEGLLAFWLAAWAREAPAVVHAARSEARARRLARALRGIVPEAEVLLLPPWDCLPYDRASPSRAVMGERVATLRRLAAPAPGPRVLLTTTEALLQRVPPREALRDATFRLAPGDALDLDAFRTFLLRTGYVVDDRVDEAGEAAVRGAVVDLFPAGAPEPFRLELEDGRIASLRRYDPLTQRTLADTGELVLEPASELLVPADALATWRAREGGQGEQPGAAAWLGFVLAGDAASPRRRGGGEHLLPLAYDRLETVPDLLPDDALLVPDPEHEERRDGFLDQVRDAHESRHSLARATGATAIVLEPERLYLDPEGWGRAVAGRPTVALAPPSGDAPPPLPRFAAAANPRAALVAFARERLAEGDRVVIAAGGGGEVERARRLARLVEPEAGVPLAEAGGWAEASVEAEAAARLLLVAGLDLPDGFRAPGLAVVAAGEVLGRSASAGTSAAAATAFLPTGFRLGDHVVHADHGVALLRGLETVEQEGGVAGEHLALEYAGEDRLLVPAHEMDRVWRYGSAESDVPLDKVGGEAWRARRAEVEAQLERAAGALAALAGERARREAPRLRPPRQRMARFAARFPFPETDDQAGAIEATLADLARGSPPMDRLVCGDVGFGKTEVALRAAAAAALSGRQVALLAPTTVLVRQHLQTFRRRFAGLGVRVEQLSRLARAAEARAVREGIADGSVRVVIGTHALASPDLRFKELGLVIIDEEQRFGTRQKEALRRLRQEGAVHVLTMSATPIPRTLQAALAGVQELSVIVTPPVRRQPVRTHVVPFDPAVVREALLRERLRGGRSFVVCPRVEDIAPMARHLAEIVPELDVVAAHGRMRADALDDAVLAFADGRHDVLLATAIIETGLDIPGANTILIHRAERFGMAQLHQLRGRVGRGRERAAAYLLHDPERPLPPATLRRLGTLEAFEGLGAGFAISARDLDLRGAGDLVGEDQAGHLRLIGTELYQHLLERALLRARGEAVAEDWSPELRLGIGAAVPPAYVPEPELRLDLYARLARLADPAAVDALAEEIDDRFGPPPPEVDRMLALARLRLRCRTAGVARLEVGPKAAAATPRDPAEAERRLARPGGALRWSDGRLVLARETATAEEGLAAAAELLDGL